MYRTREWLLMEQEGGSSHRREYSIQEIDLLFYQNQQERYTPNLKCFSKKEVSHSDDNNEIILTNELNQPL